MDQVVVAEHDCTGGDHDRTAAWHIVLQRRRRVDGAMRKGFSLHRAARSNMRSRDGGERAVIEEREIDLAAVVEYIWRKHARDRANRGVWHSNHVSVVALAITITCRSGEERKAVQYELSIGRCVGTQDLAREGLDSSRRNQILQLGESVDLETRHVLCVLDAIAWRGAQVQRRHLVLRRFRTKRIGERHRGVLQSKLAQQFYLGLREEWNQRVPVHTDGVTDGIEG